MTRNFRGVPGQGLTRPGTGFSPLGGNRSWSGLNPPEHGPPIGDISRPWNRSWSIHGGATTMTTAASSIDFAGVVARADLRTILEADLGPAKVIGGRPHWHCPFHADGNPSLYTFDGGRRWRCWPCGLVGD